MLSHRNLLALTIAHLADIGPLTEHDSQIHAAPMSHGSGLYIPARIARGGTTQPGMSPLEFMQHCPNCGAAELKIIAAILDRPVIEKILTQLGPQPQTAASKCCRATLRAGPNGQRCHALAARTSRPGRSRPGRRAFAAAFEISMRRQRANCPIDRTLGRSQHARP